MGARKREPMLGVWGFAPVWKPTNCNIINKYPDGHAHGKSTLLVYLFFSSVLIFSGLVQCFFYNPQFRLRYSVNRPKTKDPIACVL